MCDIVIASPVVVRPTFGGDNSDSSSGQVVCKAWPLMQLPLDGGYHSYTPRLSGDLHVYVYYMGS